MINTETLLSGILFILIIALFKLFNSSDSKQSCPTCPTCPTCPKCPTNNTITTNNDSFQNQQNDNDEFYYTQPPRDPIKTRDIVDMRDPLSYPYNRPDRSNILSNYNNGFYNIATQGYYGSSDTPHIMGLLYGTKKNNTGNQKILPLFGNQVYRNSNKYDYYTTVDNVIRAGQLVTKIPIETKNNKELLDGDEIKINQYIDDVFIVKLY